MTYTSNDLPKVATSLLQQYGSNRVYALMGELGAGKTTLVNEMCRQLGVTESTSSPTFSIVNEYMGKEGIIHHIDCYRLDTIDEAIDAGLEELLEEASGAVFIEWPSIIGPLLPDDAVILNLSHSEDGTSRNLSIEHWR